MPKRAIRPDDLLRFVFAGDPQVSPDGSRVLFSRKHITEKNKYLVHLYTVDTSGQLVQWTQGDESCSGGRWSPDGTRILFQSKRGSTSPQLHLISTGGGEAKALTRLPEGSIGTYEWSPDGTKIALTFREALPNRTEAAVKERAEKGLSEPAKEIDSVWYRLDGDGYFENQRYKLMVLDVATAEALFTYSEAVLGEYAFAWNPNSIELAVIHSASRRPLAEPPNDQVYRIDMSGQAVMLAGMPKGEKSAIAWSPDGRSLAWAGDVDEKDPWGTRNTKLYVAPAEGGSYRDLTGHQDVDLAVTTLSDTKEATFGAKVLWSPDCRGIFVEVGTKGEAHLGFVDLQQGGVQLLTEGQLTLSIGNRSADGRRIAAIYGSPTRLPDVAIIEPELVTGRMIARLLTDLNADFHAEVKLSEPEEIWVESTDDVKVHAWVMKPIDYLPPRRYPAVLEIHGGPHTQYGWAFFHEFQVLAAAGYVVVYSNPRGSKGYGEDHCAAIRGDWGVKDWADVQAVTRWMQHQPYIHPGQMGVMGGSYGGYMTNWVIGHCHDFAGAITDRCVSNMVSMAGNSDFPFNKDGYFKGVAWGDLESIRELWRQSPIAYFENVKTPTLIIHSEGDLRCNVEQAEQVFCALQQQGVDSRFVRYPSSTSHGMSRMGPPDLRLHRLGEILKWWERYLR